MARTAPVPNIPPIPGMCPSIAVMAGGGSGGGGSGNGAGNGNGNGPGSGDGSGDGASGDGRGAGTCGQGGKGSCSNCKSGTAAGDPIDALTGEVFTVPKTDLFLPGPFNLEIERSYSSFARRHDVGLGHGWTHTLAWRGEIRRDDILFHNGLGQTISFPKLTAAGDRSAIKGWGLMRTPHAYVLRAGDEFMHVFAPDPAHKHLLQLRAISYRNLGAIELFYDRGHLVRATDAAGRHVMFAHDADGHIVSISVPDATGATSLVFARYAYDRRGDLVGAVDADGHSWSYAYDDDHKLVSMRVPNGVVFHYVYDEQGRCIETWGAREDGARDVALAANVPALLADGRTKAKGILHAKVELGPDGYSEVIDSVRVQRFFDGERGMPAKSVNGKGGVVSRTFDAEANITSHTDANGATWRYRYDDLGHVLESIDPESRTIKFKRDSEGRVLMATDPAGGVVEFGYDRGGNVEWARNAKGAMTTYKYDARGQVIEENNADGTKVRYEHDAHGNVTALIQANGARHVFTYDFWGRRIAEQHPDGRSFAYEYSPSGQLLQARDSASRTHSYSYDGLGNLVAEREPSGHEWRYVRGGLGWLTSIDHPNGDRHRILYNLEGWEVAVVNEKGEEHLFEHNLSGAIIKERTFDGVERTYTRDARDYIVAVQDRAGKTQLERNKVGQIVRVSGRTGEEKSFFYDARGDLAGAIGPQARLEFERDPLGEVVREHLTVGGRTYTVETARDILSRRIGMSTSLGHALEARRDALGQVSELWADGDLAVRFGRDPMGWPVRRELPAGGAIVDELDAAGRVRRRFVAGSDAGARARPDEPAWMGGPAPGSIDKTYQYTPVDELASVTSPDEGTVEYEYDVRRNLTWRRGRSVDERFRYDPAGNPHEAAPNAPTRAYAAGSRLSSRGEVDYEHDARGLVIAKHQRKADGSRSTTRYHYDAWDLLRAVDLPDERRVELTYDAFARRLEKRLLAKDPSGQYALLSTTHFVWDLLSVVHQVEMRPGDAPKVTTFLYEDNDREVPIAQRERARGAGVEWLHYVHEINGAPEELVDAKGGVVARSTRTSYGKWSWSSKAGHSSPFRLPGQLEDPETGLHYNRYRTYDPETGRYLTPDPIGLDGGLNAYAYGPNPITWIDPMGLAHKMTVTSAPKGFKPEHASDTTTKGPLYESGMDPCPKDLKSRARCHTEQKFAADLLESGVKGGKYKLQGEYPPCPNCHRALQHAADNSGANITYEWQGPPPDNKKQKITYKPNTPPKGSGNPGGAARLEGRQERRLQDDLGQGREAERLRVRQLGRRGRRPEDL
ncbi:MAG: hypothetical protein IPG04_37215 [Polyangiaceae bacterium]|nr:hypothetical protein [Polyangiaceae bacterium]